MPNNIVLLGNIPQECLTTQCTSFVGIYTVTSTKFTIHYRDYVLEFEKHYIPEAMSHFSANYNISRKILKIFLYFSSKCMPSLNHLSSSSVCVERVGEAEHRRFHGKKWEGQHTFQHWTRSPTTKAKDSVNPTTPGCWLFNNFKNGIRILEPTWFPSHQN